MLFGGYHLLALRNVVFIILSDVVPSQHCFN